VHNRYCHAATLQASSIQLNPEHSNKLCISILVLETYLALVLQHGDQPVCSYDLLLLIATEECIPCWSHVVMLPLNVHSTAQQQAIWTSWSKGLKRHAHRPAAVAFLKPCCIINGVYTQ
jgi:hypothetical protein